MERRNFLRLLGLAPALALDPERLLWVPGARTIFLPPVKRNLNRFVTADWIAWDMALRYVTAWKVQQALRVTLGEYVVEGKRFVPLMSPEGDVKIPR